MTAESSTQSHRIQVEMIILTDDVHAINHQIASMYEGFAHMVRPWIKEIHITGDINQCDQHVKHIRTTGSQPVVFLALCHMASDEQEQACRQVASLDDRVLLVLLDTGQSMMRTDELAMHVNQPQRFLEMPKPMTARNWQQMLVSMARMQMTINQNQVTLKQLENFDHDHKLIEQLAQANVNAACIMAELEDARDQAMSAHQAKSHFMANMTHELRTPLSAIMGYADLMRDDVQLGEEHRDFIRCIYDNGESLLDILDSILLMTQIDSGDLKPDVSLTSPVQLITHVYHDNLKLAQDKGLELQLEIDNAQMMPSQMMLEKHWVKTILARLVDNAIKFTNEGQIELGIRWHIATTGHTLRYFVRDTGIGIDKSEHQAIFEHFHQADNSSSRNYGGVGLGLSISRKLARRLGGDITLTSEPGQGSCFELIIPCENLSHCQITV